MPGELAKLQTADGRLLVVDMRSPGGEVSIEKGDRVVVTRYAGRLDAEPVVVAGVILEQTK